MIRRSRDTPGIPRPGHRISRPPGGRRLMLTLAGVSAVSPMATDMYVPGLPQMARSLHTDTAGAQISLTGFLIGIIVGQLLCGPLSDSFGRRPVLIGGSAAFTGFSLLCGLAPTLEVLNAARLGQGLAGAAGIVVARAVVADLFDDDRIAGAFATLSAVTALAPIAAPLLGGAVLSFGSWRWLFGLLAFFGLALTLCLVLWVPESLAPTARVSGGMSGTVRSMRRVCARRSVLTPVLSLGFGGAAVFVYIGSTSFVFQGVYHLPAGITSLVFGANALGNMAASISYGRLARRHSPEGLLRVSMLLTLAPAALLFVAEATGRGGLASTSICLFVTITAFGVFFPAVTTITQSRGRDAPGATSALLGSVQFTFGAVASPLVGFFGDGSALPMAGLMAAFLVPAALAAFLVPRDPDPHGTGLPRKTGRTGSRNRMSA
ncbi:multidrug effflux MFS transporter [Streptomyces sp. NPDC048219]|uniref:multidrug effflux MFS transporter n=1 Tax=unclassified Streptomyces TaxID=2593676 RepID=UPI0034175AB8